MRKTSIWLSLVAILGIALTDAGARADSVPLDVMASPAATKFVSGAGDWNGAYTNDAFRADAYTIAGTTADDARFALVPLSAPSTEAAASSVVVTPPPPPSRQTAAPVHALPLPSTVWSGAVLLAVSAVVVWAKKRRRAGELALS